MRALEASVWTLEHIVARLLPVPARAHCARGAAQRKGREPAMVSRVTRCLRAGATR